MTKRVSQKVIKSENRKTVARPAPGQWPLPDAASQCTLDGRDFEGAHAAGGVTLARSRRPAKRRHLRVPAVKTCAVQQQTTKILATVSLLPQTERHASAAALVTGKCKSDGKGTPNTTARRAPTRPTDNSGSTARHRIQEPTQPRPSYSSQTVRRKQCDRHSTQHQRTLRGAVPRMPLCLPSTLHESKRPKPRKCPQRCLGLPRSPCLTQQSPEGPVGHIQSQKDASDRRQAQTEGCTSRPREHSSQRDTRCCRWGRSLGWGLV